MGLFGTLFSNAEEIYKEAFQKGVLLGEGSFGDASKKFDKAFDKANKEGNMELANRAYANARLYEFLNTGSSEALTNLEVGLTQVEVLEVIGSESTQEPVEKLLDEVRVRLQEREFLANADGRDQQGKAAALKDAARIFKPLFNQTLVTYRYHLDGNPNDNARGRYFYYEGKAAMHQASAEADRDPEVAAKSMATSLMSFKQCGNQDGEMGLAESRLSELRLKRMCWMCHREYQGMRQHFNYFPANFTPYIVTRLGDDNSSLDQHMSTAVLCITCSSAVENMADVIATQRTGELRAEVNAQMNEIQSEMNQMLSYMNNLQSQINDLARR